MVNKYYLENKEYYRDYQRKKWKEDEIWRIDRIIGRAIRYALHQENGSKWFKILGYDVSTLMAHLESKFKPGMSWDSYGSYWCVDHIKPRCSFNVKKIGDEEFKKCWVLENLQPLEIKINQKKGMKIK